MGSLTNNLSTTIGPNEQTTAPSENIELRPIDEGFSPIYQLTNFFLDNLVQPSYKTIYDIKDEINFNDPNDVLKSFTEKWTIWTQYLAGFTAWTVVGVFLALVLIITAVFILACRCRGSCGGKIDQMDSKHSKYIRVSLAIFLTVLSTASLFGVVVMFVTNQLIREQTLNVYTQTNTTYRLESGVLGTVTQSLDNLETYKVNTINEMRTSLIENFDDVKTDFFNELNDLGNTIKDDLGGLTGITTLQEKLLSYSMEVASLYADTMVLINGTLMMRDYGNILHLNVSTIKESVLGTISNCTLTDICDHVQYIMANLTTAANYSHVQLESIEQLSLVLWNVTTQHNMTENIKTGIDEFNQLAVNITSALNPSLQLLKNQTNTIQSKMLEFVNEVEGQISTLNFTYTKVQVEGISDEWNYYENIRYPVVLAVNCLFLLVILCYYIGLLFGACGERAGEGANACNRGNGSKVLLAGAGITLLTSWVLMIVTTALFIAGGVAHTEVCRHLVAEQDSRALPVLDSLISGALNISLSIKNTTEKCKEDRPFYDAFDIESTTGLNITKYLDLEQYGLDGTLDNIRNTKIQLSNNSFFNDAIKLTLIGLENAYKGVDFSSLSDELAKNFTTIPLREVSIQLLAAAKHLQNTTNPNIAQTWQSVAADIDHVSNTTLMLMNRLKADMSQSLVQAKSIISGTNLTTLIMDIDEAERNFTSNKDTIIAYIVNRTTTEIYSQMQAGVQDIDTEVRTNLGKCRPVYSAFMTTVNTVCVRFLYPFNSFWFSYGWCLVLFIPSLVIAMKLSGQYRKTEPYDEEIFEYAKSLEGNENKHNDSIQLDQIPRARPGGKDNPGYIAYDDLANYRHPSRPSELHHPVAADVHIHGNRGPNMQYKQYPEVRNVDGAHVQSHPRSYSNPHRSGTVEGVYF